MNKTILNVVEYDKAKYVSVSDLIQYLDNTAMDFEKTKDTCGVDVLNKLADVLSKV
jgi:hypothetical protein